MAEEKIKSGHGKIIKSWTFPEYIKYDRSRGWYIIAFIIFIILTIYNIKTGNFLFIIILVMLALIIVESRKKKPIEMKFSITENGIMLNDIFYDYNKNLNKFWIAYNPPEVKKIYFEFKNMLRTHLVIPIAGQSPLDLRDILLEYLDEDLDKEGESTAEALGRLLKL